MKRKITLKLMALVTGLSFYIVTICMTPSFAQESGSLSGIVYDSSTGQPIPDANIIVLETNDGTASQNEGYYIIQPLPKKRYDIRVKVIGYKTVTMKHILVDENTRLDFELTPSVIQYNPVIVSATKTDHLLSQVTVSAEILDPLHIRKSNGNTAGEIIESTGSVFMKNYGSVAGLQMPSIRGSNSDQVLVVMDGQKINSAMGGGVDMNNFPVEVLEKIEVIRGGHSALWGSDAIGGVIQLFSKNSIVPNDFSYGINSTVGSFGTKGINLYGMQNIGTLSYFISYNRMKSNGDFEYKIPDSGKTEKRQNNDFASNNLFLKTRIDFSAKTKLQLIFQSLRTERGVTGSTNWITPYARRNENRKLFSASFKNQLTNRFHFQHQFYWQSFDNQYIDPSSWPAADDLHENRTIGYTVQGNWKIHPSLLTTAEVEIRQDRLTSTQFPPKHRNTQSILVLSEISHGIRLLGIQTSWKWIPSLRWDSFSDADPHTCPKIGVLASSGNKFNLSIRSNYGQSYRVPSFSDLYWPEDDFTVGNPLLKPETSTNFDMGMVLGYISNFSAQIEMTYYQNDFQDLILWQPDANWKYSPVNLGKAKIEGFENAFVFHMPNDIVSLKIAHTCMKAVDETDNSENKGNRLIYRPDQKVDFTFGLNFGVFMTNLNYRFIGKRFTDAANKNSLDRYYLLNGNIIVKISFKYITINSKIQVMNILNDSIDILDGYPLPGREYRFTVGLEY